VRDVCGVAGVGFAVGGVGVGVDTGGCVTGGDCDVGGEGAVGDWLQAAVTTASTTASVIFIE
jgi:hypothetical protein